MKNNTIIRPYLITICIMLALISLAIFFPENMALKLNLESVNTLNDNWYYDTEIGPTKLPALPIDLPVKPGEPVLISTLLSSDFKTEQFICIRTSLQSVQIYLNKDLVYESLPIALSRVAPPLVSAWHLIKLPANAEGKELTIHLTSPFKAMSGKLNNIVYGNKSSILLHLISTYGVSLLFTLLIFLIGLVMFLLPLLVSQYKKWELVYLGLFAVSISLWFFSESKMLQFATGNTFLIGGLAYIMLSISILPLIFYIKYTVVKGTQKYFNILIYTFIFNTVLIIFLQLSGIMLFFESLIFTHTLIAIAFLTLIITFYYEIKILHNQTAIQFVKSISWLLLFVGIEMVHFYRNDFQNTAIYTKIGLLLFIITQAMDSVSQLIIFIKKSYMAELYEKLAFEDQLTGGLNRMAFERELQQIFTEPLQQQDTRLIILDLNRLKQINDTLGHVTGDEAIKRSFDCICQSFESIGHCFRIGGDEFAVICSNCSESLYQEHLQLLSKKIETVNQELHFNLSIAIGSVLFDPAIDENSKVFMHRADMKMYEQKK